MTWFLLDCPKITKILIYFLEGDKKYLHTGLKTCYCSSCVKVLICEPDTNLNDVFGTSFGTSTVKMYFC